MRGRLGWSHRHKSSLNPFLRSIKKLINKSLNRKWDALSLESYIQSGIIPRGLRERVVPAAHLHTENFLSKWKAECIKHGLEVMRLIVEEEKDQLISLQQQIDISGSKLEPFKDSAEFGKLKDTLKKEVDKTQRNLKITKQSKFKRDLDDWARGNIFDLITGGHRGRCRQRRHSSQAGTDHSAQSCGSEDETSYTVSFLDKDPLELEERAPPPTRGILKKGKVEATGGGRSHGKGQQKLASENQKGTRTVTRSQRQHH